MADQRLTGKVKSYDPIKGQGVIVRDDAQGELFVDVFGLNPGEEL
jgi:cold shock CspA family protein